MSKKILGIDLGTGSLGMSLRNPELGDNIQDQLEWFSVTTFNSGTGTNQTGEYSLAAERRSHVQSRRLKEHSRWMRWSTLALLLEYDMCPISKESLDKWRTYDKSKGMKRAFPIDDTSFIQWLRMDFNGDGISDCTAFQLRRDLVEKQFDFTIPINRYKLGRAIYHIALHRGFKSSKGETLAEQEENEKNETVINADNLEKALIASEEDRKKELSDYMNSHGFITVGQAFASLEGEGKRIRNSRYQAIRKQNTDEINEYFKFQKGLASYKDLHERLISTKKGVGTLFYKLPLRPQKGHIGKCTFEKSKQRCPVSHPEYEKYRAWSFINNIKYRERENGIWVELPLTLKQELYREVFSSKVRKDFAFVSVRKFIEKQLGLTLKNADGVKTINYKDNILVAGCPVIARLQNIAKLFDATIDNLKIQGLKTRPIHATKPGSEKHQVTYDALDLWHFCFEAEEIEDVKRFAKQSLRFNDDATDCLCKLWTSIEQGYTTLSLKALRNINCFLEYGLKTSDAIFLAKVPYITGEKDIEKIINLYYEKVKIPVEESQRIARIANKLIADYKSLALDERFAEHDFNYQLQKDDKDEIVRCIQSTDSSFELMDADERQTLITEVTRLYQAFFADKKRSFVEVPIIADVLVNELKKRYPDVTDRKWGKLYHPSLVLDFTRDKDDANHLGSPKIGAIRNPTVLRALNALRKNINKLLDEGLNPQETRIVIETTRVNNDINKRWAINKYNEERNDENREIEKILIEHYGAANEENISAARYVLEQTGEDIFTADNPTNRHYRHQVKKYKLWLEQGCQCLYTGRIINLTNLLSENMFDMEHTVPRSISFDSSDKNLTICDTYYNRHIKQNRIPTELPNYDTDVTIDGHVYTAIAPRLKKWQDKMERLSQNVTFWKNRAKRAQTEKSHNNCMREMLLWQMEYDYWRQKLDRFTMKSKDLTDGFRNSQLVDTGIITRYAVLYLKTLFGQVDVQNGQSTSAFRRIFGVPVKDRSTNYHHAVDATILTMIPVSAKRDRMLKLFYQIDEFQKRFGDTYGLEHQLGREIDSCKLGLNPASIDDFISQRVLVDFYKQDRTLQKDHHPVIRKGKPLKQKTKDGKSEPVTFSSDSIRGELHNQTFYGAVKRRTEEKLQYVVREPLRYKVSKNDKGFKDWEELNERIVDLSHPTESKELRPMVKMMMSQFPEGTSFKEACEQGIYMLDKNGHKVNQIRHVRCYDKNVSNPVRVKKHTYPSNKEYKRYVWAALGDGSTYALCEYSDGHIKEYKKYTYMEISENRKSGFEDIPTVYYGKKGQPLKLVRKIIKGDMLLLYQFSPDEVLNLVPSELSKRLYKVLSFERKCDINLLHHLLPKAEKRGVSVKAFNQLPQAIRCSINKLSFLQKDVDFVFSREGIILKEQ